jgi:SIR2-like domain
MELDEALRHALDGQAILFVGAGFSTQALTAKGENLPTGSKLAMLLATKLKLAATPSLDIVADMFVHAAGEFQLIQLLRDSLTADQVTPEQAIFGSVPWQRVYTTNYDNVVELAYAKQGRHIDSPTFADSPSDLTANKPACLHINGSIEKLDPRSLHSSLILTNTSYLTDTFNNSRWSHLFREDIEVARAALFIGYSLFDLDIARVLYASSRTKQKCCFVVSEAPNEETVFSLSRFGTVVPVGAKVAGRRLSELAATHVPAPPSRVFNSFRERSFATGAVPESTDVFNLYVKGELDLNLLPATFARAEPFYYLIRSELDDVMAFLAQALLSLCCILILEMGKH